MTPGEVHVRPAAAGDQARWRQLWVAYLAFYDQHLPDEVTADTWRRVLGGRDGYRCLLAVDGAAADGATVDGATGGAAGGAGIVGFVHSVPRVNTWSAAPDLYLEDLFVAPEARGRGVGAVLIEAVAARARDLGARKVTWETDAENATAQRLYDRLATRSTEVHYTLRPDAPSHGRPAT